MAKVREYSSIGFLIFALLIVIALIWQIRKNIDMIPSERHMLPEDIRVGVVDSTYWNYIQYFSIVRSNQLWEIQSFGEVDSLVPEDSTKPMFENITPLLMMTRSGSEGPIGSIEIGVVNMTKSWSPKRLAIQVLGETIREYEKKGDSVRLLTPTTAPIHTSGRGAYFVIVLPPSANEEFPVWVFAVILRRNWAFTILCRSSETDYEDLRMDFEKTIKQFRFLSIPESK
jgi:hypothetical protein